MNFPSDVDILVIGAGAAGIAAGRRLAGGPASFLIVEARDRAGGRAHTWHDPDGMPLDLGCGWLHSADQNPLVALAEAQGLTIDRSEPPWMKQSFNLEFSPEEQKDFRRAFERLDRRLETAAREPDRPASEVMEPGSRWNPMLDAFSSYYNGVPFAEVSVHDYAAYDDSDVNWRVREGYGTAIVGLAGELPIAYATPARRLDHSGTPLRVETSAGVIQAKAAIVCLPSTVLAEGGIVFTPGLPEHIEAASALPLGHVEKALLRVAEPEAFPVDGHLYGARDTDKTPNFHLRPMGRPVIEAFFGGPLAEMLQSQGRGAFAASAIEVLVDLLGSDMRHKLTPMVESDWGNDAFSRGAYSHARPVYAGMRKVLAAPAEERIFFAGEACSPHAFSTAHGAWWTGVAAAEAALQALK